RRPTSSTGSRTASRCRRTIIDLWGRLLAISPMSPMGLMGPIGLIGPSLDERKPRTSDDRPAPVASLLGRADGLRHAGDAAARGCCHDLQGGDGRSGVADVAVAL